MNLTTRALVLIADEAPVTLVQLQVLLQDQYQIKLATEGALALQLAEQLPRPELIVLAATLATPEGSSLLRQLKSNPDTAGIPIVMLLGGDDEDGARVAAAFDAGAADVVRLPMVAEALRARVATQLALRQGRALLRHEGQLLEHLVQERIQAQAGMLDAVIWAMASLAETRDCESANHIRRVQQYVVALARQLQGHPHFAGALGEDEIDLLFKAAPLHDIGKVSIPDAILLKPGRLTDDEFALMKLHTVHGRDAIAGVEQHLGYSTPFLRYAREIAYSHHERFDGSGYPQGLAGDAIPLAARLMAVADVYDALISRRVYKPAFTHETALELIRESSGEHFDPDVVDALLTVEEQFMDIAARCRDIAPV